MYRYRELTRRYREMQMTAQYRKLQWITDIGKSIYQCREISYFPISGNRLSNIGKSKYFPISDGDLPTSVIRFTDIGNWNYLHRKINPCIIWHGQVSGPKIMSWPFYWKPLKKIFRMYRDVICKLCHQTNSINLFIMAYFSSQVC